MPAIALAIAARSVGSAARPRRKAGAQRQGWLLVNPLPKFATTTTTTLREPLWGKFTTTQKYHGRSVRTVATLIDGCEVVKGHQPWT